MIASVFIICAKGDLPMKQLQLNAFLSYRFLSNIQYAPGGRRAAFVVSRCDEEENAYASCLYLYDGSLRQLTGLGGESAFTWLDETHLLFPAQRSPKEKKRAEAGEAFTSYYTLDVTGGEALPAFTLPFAAQSGLKVLDSTHFAVLGAIDANIPDEYQMTAEAQAQVAKNRKEEKDYEVFDELPFWQNGQGVTNKQRTALFLVSTQPLEIRRMTPPLASVGALALMGDELIYDEDTYTAKPRLRGCRLHALNWRTGEDRLLCQEEELSVSQLVEAGETLYLLGATAAAYGLNENDWIYTLNPVTGEITLVRQEPCSLYGSVGSDCRYGGGTERQGKAGSLYCLATREGSALLYRYLPDGSEEPLITREGSIDSFALSDSTDQVLLIALYGMKLQELYAFDPATRRITQLSHFNDAVLKGSYVAKPQPLTAESLGETIGGWVLLPKDYDPAQTYPAILDIHGGPKTVYGPVFYHEMQLWANRGFFVFCCNPKGSDGRDNAFADIRGHYGDQDYQNLMDFTDRVLAAYPAIDQARLCVTGGSYGGFMTNWIIGHTHRFCCAASQRSIANWLSFYGVSDIGFCFAGDQNACDPLEAPEQLWAHSPLRYAARAKTPTLFIHSDADYRCPLSEGLQMYAALVDHGVPARLCLFHGENHELSRSGKPKHRLRRLTEITDWFEKYAK